MPPDYGYNKRIWVRTTSNWSELCLAMGCTRVTIDGCLAHMFDVSVTGTFYNFAIVQHPDTCSIRTIEAEFVERHLPFAVRIPRQESYFEFEKSLSAIGFSLTPVWTMMKHNEERGSISPEITVEQISPQRLAEWMAVSNIFSLPDIHRAAQQKLVSRATRVESVCLLLASFNNNPAGVALVFHKDGVGSIHLVATLPKFRRKNVATTIVLQAIEQMKDDEIDLIWLRTRKGGIGEKVYSRIGFKPFVDILTYAQIPALDQAMAVPVRSN
jgi:ribosomal protein S18 acetylase RimI-like enzyme